MTYAVDIETIPDLTMIDFLPEVSASKTLKDPVKIAADIEEKQKKQRENMGLDSIFAKIICIGIYSPEKSFALMGEEKDIIQEFWDIVGQHSQIITFILMLF